MTHVVTLTYNHVQMSLLDYKDRNLGQSTLFIDRQSTQRAVNNNGLLLLSSRLLKLHTSNK